MIQLDKHKIIFIKTQRTASTTTAIQLSLHASETDIVSELDQEERFYRARNSEGYHEWTLARDIPYKIRKAHKLFCIEREPVSKCISHYSWLLHNDSSLDFSWEEYLDSALLPIDYFRYTNSKNKLIVNKIIKYENLAQELSDYLPIKLERTILARAIEPQDVTVTDQQREFIYEQFSESNKHTGYSLENISVDK